jgi:uncharacterized membrane protein (DUF106 family)
MILNVINKIVNGVFDVIFYPAFLLPSGWALFVISALTGFLMILIFKRVSNQSEIKRVKNRIWAHLLGLRLYRNDAALSIKAVLNMFANNGKYLTLAIKPLLILMIPVLLVIFQLASRYEFRPLKIGERAIVEVTVAQDVPLTDVHLDSLPAIEIETSPLRILGENQISWRIRAVKEGIWTLRFRHGDRTVSKQLVIGEDWKKMAAHRVRGNSLRAMLFPAESVIPTDDFLKDIHVQYPQRDLVFAGVRIHWFIFFFIASILTGFIFKPVFKVEI